MSFVPSTSQASAAGVEEVALTTVYKHGISLFRSLFALLRLLPAWQMGKTLRRRRRLAPAVPPPTAGGGGDRLGIEIRTRSFLDGNAFGQSEDEEERRGDVLKFGTCC